MYRVQKYTGLDVSATILKKCIEIFAIDASKNFFLYGGDCFQDNTGIFRADASMSVDVLFHLVEMDVFKNYLNHLFQSASKLVIIYAADHDYPQKTEHELYRKFTPFIAEHFPDWELLKVVKNKYPATHFEDAVNSLADFYFYAKRDLPI